MIILRIGVKDTILATTSETPRVENAPAEMLRDMDQQMEGGQMMVSTLWIKLYSEYEYEIRYHPGKANVVTDALSRKERVKPRRVPLVGSKMDEAHASRYLLYKKISRCDNSKEWNSGDDQLRLRWVIYLVVLAGAAKSVRDAMWFENCLESSSGWTRVLRLKLCMEGNVGRLFLGRDWESSLTGLELVQETTDKVVLEKEKLKVEVGEIAKELYVNIGVTFRV
ncbi:hypothetical protein Tco_0508008 [Tanacetum coccineum]